MSPGGRRPLIDARQAQTQHTSADSTVTARLPETYQWALAATQKDPGSSIEWQASRLSGSDHLAARASKKLRADELLITNLGGTLARRALDKVPLWRGEHVSVRTLVEGFAQQLYLPRLVGPAVLAEALRTGVAALTWRAETFAYAETFDETTGRYPGLRGGEQVAIATDDPGLIVKPGTAGQQLDTDTPQPPPDAEAGAVTTPGDPTPAPGSLLRARRPRHRIAATTAQPASTPHA